MSYWKDLEEQDILGKLAPLFREGRLYIDPEDQKIKKPRQVMLITNPFIFAKPATWMNCALWHQIYFKQLGVIHSACFECFKVVVRPETVKELFQVCDIMQELALPGKCGIEVREYVKHLYGAYFYCKGLEEGREIYSFVKDTMQREIRPDISVILKRGCTEFELLHGDSKKYEQKDYDRKLETWMETHSDIAALDFEQPEYLKIHIKRGWLAWAYKNNDKTCLEFNDGEDFVKQPATYHDIKDANHGNDL